MVSEIVLKFLETHKEFSSRDFVEYMIKQGYSYTYARDMITQLKYLNLIELKFKKGRKTIYISKIFKESEG